MNRDYFTRPIQSDRNSAGYGHTQLHRDSRGSQLVARLCYAAMAVAVIWFAAQFLR